MRRFAMVVAIFCGLGLPPAFAQFRYQPEKMVAGTAYNYVKTNVDGTAPENVAIYLVSPDSVVALKYHAGAEQAGLVGARMDWNSFCVARLSSSQLFYTGEQKLFATLQYLPEEKSVLVEIVAAKLPPEKAPIPRTPFHIYNFDFISLNLAFRHLIAPEKSFVIGIADPTFAEGSPVFAYKGEVEIKYLGDEQRGGVACRKYTIDGAGLQNRGGMIWVDKAAEHIVDLEIALPNNPGWQSYKLRLLSVSRMNQRAWEAFIKDRF